MVHRVASPVCSPSRRVVLAMGSLSVLALCACGGASSSTAKTPDDESTSIGAGPAMPDNAPPDNPLLDCGDGTCSRCGNGICTQGMYCNESARGGPACNWLPECPESPDCSCIEKVLGSRCECEEQDGAAHVRCKK
ncbi:MAG: hypothetical protein JW940_37340 [Polyangiaceae bacterium]|nr:hypothetical protein [Polyangiaceae bacterium]